ncbi:hypothetical protein LOTGIDRAFT_104185 [Lottia gigantea]|uniref:Citrate transporter-like domain-containing protein n=1 Tax=Lottia gigantea TaxID=225164 RepID=V4C7W2_LOTGI|nr:hypothetical protein LOTGIDRAFT_104185 [Lottia gigantea]ESO97809.1 hypothetical protein LOTGIDRAFT_104185 [Lottia gigantea]
MGLSIVLRQLWSIRVLFIMVLTPLLLLALPLYIGTVEAKAAFVLILMAVLWITEAVPIAVTAMLPIFLFPMLGVVKAKDIAPAYMSDTLMVFIGGLIMATAIETWDIHKLLALRILLSVGSKPRWLMLGLMLPTWFLSMWISNTATTAMMIPIAQAILAQLKATNILLKEETADSVIASLPHPFRLPTHPWVYCDDLSFKYREAADGDDIKYKKLCKAISLCICYAANCGGIGALTGTGPNLVVKGFADELYAAHGLKNPVTYATWMGYGLPLSFLVLMVTWNWLQFFFLGFSALLFYFSATFSCKDKKQSGENKVQEMIRKQYDALGPVTYAQKNVLVLFSILVVCWITRDLGGVGGWGDLFQPLYVRDSTPAILVAVLLFFLPSELPPIFCNRDKKNDRDMFRTPRPLLTWQNVHEKLPWGLFILLGGGFALAKGCHVSGLSRWIGLQLEVFIGLNKWLMLLVLCYICEMLTEFISNVALATLIIPILAELAMSTGVNPLFYILPAAVSASFAYMLPVATAPNALCFSYGHIRVLDMVTAGFFMNLIAIPMLVFATFTWGDAIFHFQNVPFTFDSVNKTLLLNSTM